MHQSAGFQNLQFKIICESFFAYDSTKGDNSEDKPFFLVFCHSYQILLKRQSEQQIASFPVTSNTNTRVLEQVLANFIFNDSFVILEFTDRKFFVFLFDKIELYRSVFFQIGPKCVFRHTYFICQLAVRVGAIIPLAKIFWSRKDEIFHSFWFQFYSFIDFETLEVFQE